MNTIFIRDALDVLERDVGLPLEAYGGGWHVRGSKKFFCATDKTEWGYGKLGRRERAIRNARFIANAPEYIQYLLDEREKLIVCMKIPVIYRTEEDAETGRIAHSLLSKETREEIER